MIIEDSENIPSAEILNYRQRQEDMGDKMDFFSEGQLFIPPSWENCLDLLQELCYHRNCILVTTGQRGVGKTSLMHQFIDTIHGGTGTTNHLLNHVIPIQSRVSEQVRTCQIYANSQFDNQQLLNTLTEGFRLSLCGEDLNLDEQLEHQLNALQTIPQLCLLLIDNAETLSAEMIKNLIHLISLQSETQMRLHILLFGDLQLHNNLQIFRQDESLSHHIYHLPLEPFNEDETGQYIHSRVANHTPGTPMTLQASVLEMIYKLSKGIPSEINKLAPKFLMSHFTGHEKQATTWTEKVRLNQTRWIGGLVILVFIMMASYLINKNPLRNHVLTYSQMTAPKPIPASLPLVPTTSAPIAPPAPMIINTQATPIAPPAPPVSNPIAKLAVAVPPLKIKAKSVPAIKSAQATNSEQYLLTQDPATYTLQLLAAHEVGSIRKVINKNHLGTKAHRFAARRLNQNWQILVYGVYPTHDTATQAISTLPTNIQHLHPWVRKMSAVQEEIKEFTR